MILFCRGLVTLMLSVLQLCFYVSVSMSSWCGKNLVSIVVRVFGVGVSVPHLFCVDGYSCTRVATPRDGGRGEGGSLPGDFFLSCMHN